MSRKHIAHSPEMIDAKRSFYMSELAPYVERSDAIERVADAPVLFYALEYMIDYYELIIEGLDTEWNMFV